MKLPFPFRQERQLTDLVSAEVAISEVETADR